MYWLYWMELAWPSSSNFLLCSLLRSHDFLDLASLFRDYLKSNFITASQHILHKFTNKYSLPDTLCSVTPNLRHPTVPLPGIRGKTRAKTRTCLTTAAADFPKHKGCLTPLPSPHRSTQNFANFFALFNLTTSLHLTATFPTALLFRNIPA
jgi:hypothetical protein